MFCSNCGSFNADGVHFCGNCGAALGNNSTVEQQTFSQAPQQELKMGWYKFLIYFGLFAGAVLNFITGITSLNGSKYGTKEEVELVYDVFDNLKTLDIIVGFALIALAVFGIFTRFRLSGYHENGPSCLNILYTTAAAINLIYIIGIYIILPEEALKYLDFTSVAISISVSVAMIAVNVTYFKKRKHLFVNK